MDHTANDNGLLQMPGQPMKTNLLACTSALLALGILPAAILALVTFGWLFVRWFVEAMNYGYGQNPLGTPNDAIAGVLLLVSLGILLVLLIAAPVTGVVALNQINRSAGHQNGRPLAWIGIAGPALIPLLLVAISIIPVALSFIL